MHHVDWIQYATRKRKKLRKRRTQEQSQRIRNVGEIKAGR